MTELAVLAAIGLVAAALFTGGSSPLAAAPRSSSSSSGNSPLEGRLSVNEVRGLASRIVSRFGFDAEPEMLTVIAFMESSGNAAIGVHPDGVSLGLMGLTRPVLIDNAGRGHLAFPNDRETVLESAEASIYHAAAHLGWLRTHGGTRHPDELVIRAYNAGFTGASRGGGADYLQRFRQVKRQIGV